MDIIHDYAALGKLANLKALEGRPQSVEYKTAVAQIWSTPESETHTLTIDQLPSQQDYPAKYWPGPGQRWVQDASGKWVTEPIEGDGI